MTSTRPPSYPLRFRPPLRAAADRLAARLGLTLHALLSALVADALDREGVEPVPPPGPWTSGPRLDEEGDRERVRAIGKAEEEGAPKKREG